MKVLLEKAGAAFLRAFGAAAVTYGAGLAAAPNLNQAYLLGVAALVGSITAGLRAIQVFVPQVSVSSLFGDEVGKYADSFLRAFLGAFLVAITGALNAPDLSTAKSLAVAAITGAIAAGFRALQATVTKGENPAPQTGIEVNPK